MSVQIARRQFTVDEFYRMAKVGIFTEDDRVELIDGEVVEMSPIGSRHASCVNRLNRLFLRLPDGAAVVIVQNPLRLNKKSEPVPDVVVAKPRADFYAESHPGPGDVLLVVEVADTTLRYDRRVKVPLYARAGIPEVWIVNLVRGVIEVYARPDGDSYSEIRKAERGEVLTPLLMPSLTLAVEDITG
ncbi:MAG TPA: Uma2 family endonuclease [Pyrinomonadaceae bacterium]|nr:Uma2 family endonuclease [Pyrinomonadaceae bacterium]